MVLPIKGGTIKISPIRVDKWKHRWKSIADNSSVEVIHYVDDKTMPVYDMFREIVSTINAEMLALKTQA